MTCYTLRMFNVNETITRATKGNTMLISQDEVINERFQAEAEDMRQEDEQQARWELEELAEEAGLTVAVYLELTSQLDKAWLEAQEVEALANPCDF